MLLVLFLSSTLAHAQVSQEVYCRDKTSNYEDYQVCMKDATRPKWQRILKRFGQNYNNYEQSQKKTVQCQSINGSTFCQEN